MVSANILFVVTVGLNVLAAIRFVQNVIISWVTQNQSISYTIVKCLIIIIIKEMLIETFLLFLFPNVGGFLFLSPSTD